MKQTITVITALLVLTLFSCQKKNSNNSTPQQVNAANKFAIQSTGLNYNTPNAYILFDDDMPLKNQFMLVLSEATIREDNINGVSIETSTNHLINVAVQKSTPAYVNNEQAVSIGVGTFPTISDALAFTNITSYQNTYTSGFVQFGDPDVFTEYQQGNGNGSLVINSFIIDYTTRVGTIDCDFVINTGAGDKLSGHYDGSFELLKSNF